MSLVLLASACAMGCSYVRTYRAVDSCKRGRSAAGVVGLAAARALALTGREVLVIERADAVGTGTSSRNSEIIHAGAPGCTSLLSERILELQAQGVSAVGEPASPALPPAWTTQSPRGCPGGRPARPAARARTRTRLWLWQPQGRSLSPARPAGVNDTNHPERAPAAQPGQDRGGRTRRSQPRARAGARPPRPTARAGAGRRRPRAPPRSARAEDGRVRCRPHQT